MRCQGRILPLPEGDLVRLQVVGLHDLEAIHGKGVVQRAPDPQRDRAVDERRELHGHDRADVDRELPARLGGIRHDQGKRRPERQVDHDDDRHHVQHFGEVPPRPAVPAEVHAPDDQCQCARAARQVQGEGFQPEFHVLRESFSAGSAGTGLSSTGAGSPGMARCSVSQAPRSISRQRSLQNGRNGALSHSSSRWQVGQLTRTGLTALDPQLQQLSVKVTSVWAWVGRAVSPFQVRKRMLQR